MTKQVDRVYRVRYSLEGGHYHMRIFSAKSHSHTFAKLGDLVCGEEEFISFQLAFAFAEFIADPKRKSPREDLPY